MAKRVTFIVLVLSALLLPATTALSQGLYTLTAGAESRRADATLLREGRYMGMYEGLHCWVGAGENHRMQVTLLDQNLEPLKSMALPESTVNCELLAATMDDGKVSMLIVDSSYNKMTLIYSSIIDLSTMLPADGTMPMTRIDSLGYGRKDKCYVWGAASPNGKYLGLVAIVEYTERKQYSTIATLYNSHLQSQWSKQYALGSMDNLCLTDDGIMVTLGHEDAGQETHFIFNILSRTISDSYDAVVQCDPIRQLKLAGIAGRKAIAVGTFTPLGSRERDNLCGGVVGMAFDIDSANITSFTMRPFQNEDMNILLNTKTKKVQRDQWLDLISMVGTTMTDYGAVVAVGRNYRVASKENNGTVSTEFFRVGLHLVAIDTTGHVRWARNLRRNDCQRKDVDLLGVNLVSFDGKVLVARSEPHRTPAIYDISNVAKKLKMGDKSSLALYTIAADGEVQKQILETKSKHSLIRSIVRRDGTLMMITENGRRLRLAEAKKEVSGD